MPPHVVPHRSDHPKAKHFPWHYVEPGFEDDPIVGHSEELLLEAVTKFRLDNDLDVGDVKADVTNYHRSRNPPPRRPRGIKKKTGPAPAQTEVRSALRADQRTLLDKVRTWVKRVQQKGWEFQPLEIASARAEICFSCPANRKIEEVTLCGPCIPRLKRDIANITKRKNAKLPAVGVCQVCHQANAIAAYMPEEELKVYSVPRLDDDAPEQCWLRNLSSGVEGHAATNPTVASLVPGYETSENQASSAQAIPIARFPDKVVGTIEENAPILPDFSGQHITQAGVEPLPGMPQPTLDPLPPREGEST